MALEIYRRKRNVQSTAEPQGKAVRRRSGSSFVVQKHAASRLHYDFRLELDGVLKSWAVPKGPSLDPSEKRLAVEVEDHPVEYGAFEGSIPAGQYGGGEVLLWDRGTWIPRGDPRAGLKAGQLEFDLEGQKLQGGWALVRLARSSGGKSSWLLVKKRDAYAADAADDILISRPESVASGRTLQASSERPKKKAPFNAGSIASLDDAPRAPLPNVVAAQLATLVAVAPAGDEWLHETKFDGYRMFCRLEHARCRLLTRTGQDWTARFEQVAATAARLKARHALLDGEIVALGSDGKTRFQALQNAPAGAASSVVYFVFDVLHLEGHDLTPLALETRKSILASLLKRAARGTLRYSDHVVGGGAEAHADACRRGFEGIVSKRRDAPYLPRRTRDWLKVKCVARQEFVIGGYTEPRGSRAGFGALLLGVREGTRLRYCGKVGTGFTAASLRELHRRLSGLEIDASPFADAPRSRTTHWVAPRLVAEVSFTEWTDDGQLRHPSFQGLRDDKAARSVVAEKPAGAAPGRKGRGVRR
jgi:bifunctional non-homologous end joining protein LigD